MYISNRVEVAADSAGVYAALEKPSLLQAGFTTESQMSDICMEMIKMKVTCFATSECDSPTFHEHVMQLAVAVPEDMPPAVLVEMKTMKSAGMTFPSADGTI